VGHFKKNLIYKLFIAWLILSVIIGGAVFFISTKAVDHFIRSHAEKQAHHVCQDLRPILIRKEPDLPGRLREKILPYIEREQFVSVEIYGVDREGVIEITHPDLVAIEEFFDDSKHDHLLTTDTQSEMFQINKQIYIQLFLPITDTKGIIIGHFEGVYKVNHATLISIRIQRFISLVLVALTILINTILLYLIMIQQNKNLMSLSKELVKANIGMLEVLGSTIAKRDSDTNEHNYRVTIYAIRLAEAIKVAPEDIRSLIKGSFLHDVGKIAISDNILLKPTKLTPSEFEVMKTHVDHGVDLVLKYQWLQDALPIVQYHHEKYDGQGYMAGLKADSIPLPARIFTIADVFDALTSKRPYKEALSFQDAVSIMRKERGKHFDPTLLDEFINLSFAIHQKLTTMSASKLKKELSILTRKYFEYF